MQEEQPRLGLQDKIEGYIINVPQGRSACLAKSTTAFLNIKALYTGGFSTCNIIVCINQDRISLIHVDKRCLVSNIDKIIREIKWVEETGSSEIIIIYRDMGKLLTKGLLRTFHEELPDKEIELKQMDSEHDGIVVSFGLQEKNELHRNIKKLPINTKPENLIHHPQEEKFLAVQKIEQIISVKADIETHRVPAKKLFIFDGKMWEPIEESELKINVTHPITEKEMNFFQPDDSFVIICQKLRAIVRDWGTPSADDMYEETVAFYLESYLNNFYADLIFRRNMIEVLIYPDYKPTSPEESSFKDELMSRLKDSQSDLQDIFSAFVDFKENYPDTAFKEVILIEYEHYYYKHYNERMAYKKIEVDNKNRLEALKKKSSYAAKDYASKKYAAAANLFMEVLKEAIICCPKDSPELAKAYYNCGRSLQQCGRFQEAKFFLEHASLLYKDYVPSSSSNSTSIHKTAIMPPFFSKPFETSKLSTGAKKGDTLLPSAASIRPTFGATASSSARCSIVSAKGFTPVRLPYILSAPLLSRRFRQKIRLSGYVHAGGVVLGSLSARSLCAPSKRFN